MSMHQPYCDQHGELKQKIEHVKECVERAEADNAKEHEDIWVAIDKLQNRLPLWATFLIGGMGTVIGYLLALVKGD